MDLCGEYYDLILNEAKEMVFLCEGNGRIQFCNKVVYDELGFTREELDNRNIYSIFRAFFIPTGTELKFTQSKEWRRSIAYKRNETCISVDLKVVRFQEPEEGFLCIAIDAQKEENMERELERSEVKLSEALNVKNEFSANVTHELRTPLNGIQGITRLLLNGTTSAEQEENLKIIDECCKNMSKIINDLLDISKLQAGKFLFEEEKFKFQEFFESVIAIHMNHAREKGLEFYYSMEEDIPEELIGDSFRLGQVINNLLNNAIKFTKDGKVSIDVILSQQYEERVELFFVIMDTGIGVDQNDRGKLFQSFTQVDASITRKFGGTGLGLSICKEIVERMGGKIEVSGEKGVGSCFNFTVQLRVANKSYNHSKSGEHVVKDLNVHQAEEQKIEDIIVNTKSNLSKISDDLLKLKLCFDLDSWKKAEGIADELCNSISKEDEILHKLAFRLKLMVRKENYVNSTKICREIEKIVLQLRDRQ